MAMKYYPIFLDLQGRQCLVVGGGRVGFRKAVTLERCGAMVKVISEGFSTLFETLKTKGICLEKKAYEQKDVTGMFLVFAATNNARLNRQIKADASGFNLLCNVADAPDQSDFILPSIVDKGDLVVAVSTSGSSPAMAKKIRQDLSAYLGSGYDRTLTVMKNIRKKLLSSGHDPEDHKKMFHSLIDKGIVEQIRAKDETKVNLLLWDVLGKEYTYQNLVSSRSDE